MHIAVDGTALYGRYNGVEYALWNLLAALRGIDTQNRYTVYIPQDGPPAERLAAFGSRWNWVLLPFEGGNKLRRIFWQQVELPRLLRRERFDLLHSPTYVAPLFSPIPVVLTIYDTIALGQPEFASAANRLHYGWVLPRSLTRAQRIIVPSEMVRQDVMRLAPQVANRCRVVPLSVESAFHEAPSAATLDEVRQRYNLPERFVFFVGNWEPKKNLPRLLRALEAMPTAPPLVLAGGGRAWLSPELDALRQSGRVISTGYVWRRDLPALYHLCELFAFPSLAEGFGLPVMEALACGAPVVTSDRVPIAGLRDVVALCDPLEEASIGAALQCVLNDATLREELSRRAREFASPYTTRRTAEQTLAVYDEVGRGRL
jgi:glycosyltransferase involved in cell wall biosynthesis